MQLDQCAHTAIGNGTDVRGCHPELVQHLFGLRGDRLAIVFVDPISRHPPVEERDREQ